MEGGSESLETQIGNLALTLATRISRRGILGAGAALALGSIAAACGLGSSPSGSQAKKKVALLLPSYTQVRWKVADQAYFESEAKKLGVFDVIFQQANDNATTQSNQVENVLTQGIDLLVLCPADVDAAKNMVRKANTAKVPVISYNYSIMDVDIAALISRDAVQVGRDLANAMVQKVPKGNYVNVFLPEALSVGRDKAQGTLEVLKPLVDRGDIKVVSQQYVDISDLAGLAQKQVEAALVANRNNIQAIIAHNNNLEYGVVAALSAQGLAGKIQTTGEDCETHSLNLIKSGQCLADSFTPFNDMGAQAARAAAAILQGKAPAATRKFNNNAKQVPWVEIKAFNVTQDNLQQFAKDYPWWIDKTQATFL